jgi:hypothetical protein
MVGEDMENNTRAVMMSPELREGAREVWLLP